MLGDQSSVKVDPVERAEVIKGLENEGSVVKVVRERKKRTIRNECIYVGFLFAVFVVSFKSIYYVV